MTTLSEARKSGADKMRDDRKYSARQQLRDLLQASGPMLLADIERALHWEHEYAYSIVRKAQDHGVLHGINGPTRTMADRKYELGAAQPRQFRNLFCPACSSRDVRQLKSGWRCNACRSTFDQPRVDEHKSHRACGSGVIAGPCHARGYRWFGARG